MVRQVASGHDFGRGSIATARHRRAIPARDQSHECSHLLLHNFPSMRVLVVEDDLPMAAAIRRALRGVNVIGDVAGTSGAACAMLADTAYDVVVLDAMLPDADGFVTCRRLRSSGEWTPIIMVTARMASMTGSAGWMPERTTTSASRLRSVSC